MDFGTGTEDVRKRIRRDVSCRRLWVRSARKTVQRTVFSGERAAAQENEGRRSPKSISCAVREALAPAVRARHQLGPGMCGSRSETEGCSSRAARDCQSKLSCLI